MISYLFFDNFKNQKKSSKEKGLNSSLFSFNEIAVQMINAGFYFKRIWKMPENLNVEHLKLTEKKELFHICEKYVDFDELSYINSIINILNQLNPKNNFKSSKSLVNLITQTKETEINPITFSFFFKNIKINDSNLNIYPDIPQLIPVYEHYLGKILENKGKTKSLDAYNLFLNKYFFLNLPKSDDPDSILKIIKEKNIKNLPLLEFPFYIKGRCLDETSFNLFNKMMKYIPIKLHILTENIDNKEWESFKKFKIDIQENIEINNFTIKLYEKHQTIGKITLNSNNCFDFFNKFNREFHAINKNTNSNTSILNQERIIEEELKNTKITSKVEKNYKSNLKNQGIILKELGNHYFLNYNYNKSKYLYLKAMEIFASICEKDNFEKVEYNLALIELNLCNTDFAVLYFQEQLSKAKLGNNKKDIAFALASLGKSYLLKSKLNTALQYTLDSYELIMEIENSQTELKLIYQLSSVYFAMEETNESEKYLKLLEEKDLDNQFKNEILFLNCEMYISKNNNIQAKKYFKEIEKLKKLPLTDEIHKNILQSILENKSDDYNKNLFTEISKIQIPYIANALKIKLMKNFNNLVFKLEETQILKEINAVKYYNYKYYLIYKNALIKKRISKIDNKMFGKLNQLLSLGIDKNNESFQDILSSIGDYLGLGKLKISSGKVKNANFNYVIDSSGKICINSENPFDSKLLPFLDFISNLSAYFIKSSIVSSDENFSECAFLKSIIGNSCEIISLKKKLQQVADFDFPILIVGNSGTGKEMAAKAVHYCSKRNKLPFLAINCAALPENLIESQLFGHTKGAFTGAINEKQGIFQEAGNGTVFLDEIGELSLNTQAKLLRVLQEKEAFKVGSNKPFQINCRFVFATNRNLKEEIKNKNFREDLFFRIAGIEIFTPDLKDRKEDIPLLAEHFLKPYEKTLSPDTEILLMKHKYKGNVRELQNILTSAIVSSENENEITRNHLPDMLKPDIFPVFTGELKKATAKFQKNYITKVLTETNFNNSKAAKKLGITRQRLIQLKKQYEI